MGDLVNLRLERKRKTREQAESDADVRRAAFGRTKADKVLNSRNREREERILDLHRIAHNDEGA